MNIDLKVEVKGYAVENKPKEEKSGKIELDKSKEDKEIEREKENKV